MSLLIGAPLGVSIHRTLEHRRMILKEFGDLSDAAKGKSWGKYLLGLADVVHLVCNLTQEAGLETVLSAAFSLKHAANMKKRRLGSIGERDEEALREWRLT